jgi:hypothetical protein
MAWCLINQAQGKLYLLFTFYAMQCKNLVSGAVGTHDHIFVLKTLLPIIVVSSCCREIVALSVGGAVIWQRLLYSHLFPGRCLATGLYATAVLCFICCPLYFTGDIFFFM